MRQACGCWRQIAAWEAKLVKDHPGVPTLLDTQANLLYKAGKRPEAIALEEEAVQKAEVIAAEQSVKLKTKIDPDKSYQETLGKMKNGIPTWGG